MKNTTRNHLMVKPSNTRLCGWSLRPQCLYSSRMKRSVYINIYQYILQYKKKKCKKKRQKKEIAAYTVHKAYDIYMIIIATEHWTYHWFISSYYWYRPLKHGTVIAGKIYKHQPWHLTKYKIIFKTPHNLICITKRISLLVVNFYILQLSLGLTKKFWKFI